jgi:hypothetical protein
MQWARKEPGVTIAKEIVIDDITITVGEGYISFNITRSQFDGEDIGFAGEDWPKIRDFIDKELADKAQQNIEAILNGEEVGAVNNG